MSPIDGMAKYRSFDSVQNCARRYWSGVEQEPGALEMLALCDLIIVDRITKIAENGIS